MKWKYAALLFLFVFIMFFYQKIVPYNSEILRSLLFSLIPSLLPALILTHIVIGCGSLDLLYSKIHRKRIGRLLYFLLLVFIASSLGMPSMQILIEDQKKKGILTARNADHFICSFGGVSFPFLYGVCLLRFPDPSKGIRLLILFYLSDLLCLLSQSFRIEDTDISVQSSPILSVFGESMMRSMKTVALICSTVLIFSLFLFLFESLEDPFNYMIAGCFEFSYPCYQSAAYTDILHQCIVLFFSVFPSLSILIQSEMIRPELNMKKYVFYRGVTAVFAVCCLFLLS